MLSTKPRMLQEIHLQDALLNFVLRVGMVARSTERRYESNGIKNDDTFNSDINIDAFIAKSHVLVKVHLAFNCHLLLIHLLT